MNIFFKNKKNIIIIMVFFIILIFGYYFFHNSKKDIIIEEKPDFSTRDLSRVSFFHRENFRCTMAIPEDWEGEYRMRENSNKVNFSYIIDPENSPEIFFIRFYNSDDKVGDEEIEIMGIEDKIFTYKLSTGSLPKISNKEKFIRMQEDVYEIIKTLKCNVND